MAKLTIGQKSTRLLYFLMGLRNHAIAGELARFGFGQDTLDEGWTLLRSVAGDRLEAVPIPPTSDEVAALDGWENRWFPIVGAVLKRHHPAEHAQVFNNLTQTTGPEVVLSVGTLLTRLDAIAAAPSGGAVQDTLVRHGFTAEVVAKARLLMTRIMQVSQQPSSGTVVSPEELLLRERAMWDFYLQWSTIARSVIRDRRMLRQLGFLKSRGERGDSAGEPGDDELDDDDLDSGDELDDGDELDAGDSGDPEAGDDELPIAG